MSREVSARLKEFEAAVRVIDALRGVMDDDRSGDALIRRLLGGEAPARPSKAAKRQDDPVPVVVGQPVDLGSRALGPLPVLVIAAAPYRGRDQVGVVGLTADGQKRVVLFREGSTADPVAMDNLCRALEARALSPRLCVTDGGLALDREVADSFPACLIAHADPYVERAVLSHLADGPAQSVKARLRAALEQTGGEAQAALTALVADMRGRAPGTYQTLSRQLLAQGHIGWQAFPSPSPMKRPGLSGGPRGFPWTAAEGQAMDSAKLQTAPGCVTAARSCAALGGARGAR